MSYFENKASNQSGSFDDLLEEEVQEQDFVFIVNGATGELKSVFCPSIAINEIHHAIPQVLEIFGIDEIGGQPPVVH